MCVHSSAAAAAATTTISVELLVNNHDIAIGLASTRTLHKPSGTMTLMVTIPQLAASLGSFLSFPSLSSTDTEQDGSQLLQSSTSRWLEEQLGDTAAGDIDPYTSTGFIVWYILLVCCCFVPMACCCFLFVRNKCNDSVLDNQRALDAEISRMEANILAFSKEERQRKKEQLKRLVEPYCRTLTEADLANPNTTATVKTTTTVDANEPLTKTNSTDDDSGSDGDTHSHSHIVATMDEKAHIGVLSSQTDFSDGCTICLGPYACGDKVVRSANTSCQHVFHQRCLVEWLSFRSDPLCPCCRQPFLERRDTPKTTEKTASMECPATTPAATTTATMETNPDEEQPPLDVQHLDKEQEVVVETVPNLAVEEEQEGSQDQV